MHTIYGNSTPHATHEYGANQAGSFSISMKSPLSFEEQLDLMIGRGLIVNDRPLAYEDSPNRVTTDFVATGLPTKATTDSNPVPLSSKSGTPMNLTPTSAIGCGAQ